MISIGMFETQALRHGTILEPANSAAEAGGILNPAAVRTREGALLLYPRLVAAGNVSRIGIVRVLERGDSRTYVRVGYALEPEREYELRAGADGYGCEGPRITFIAARDSFVMAYTAFGPRGPRIAVALSKDGLAWQRLGLVPQRRPSRRGRQRRGVFSGAGSIAVGGPVVRLLSSPHARQRIAKHPDRVRAARTGTARRSQSAPCTRELHRASARRRAGCP
jgi:hypothetical protein